MFKNVIVKKPGNSFINGLTTSDLGKPDLDKLFVQHEQYIEALKKCGVEVTKLAENEAFPDSTFVEDTAVLTKDFAIITNPGAEARNREIEDMEPIIKRFYNKLYYISAPGTLEGGDVLQIGKQFYVGISTRTNEEGAQQFKEIVEKEGYEATIITLKEFFHLKTGVNYIGNNRVLVAGEFINHPAFEHYERIVIPQEDEYSANCVHVNEYVLIPAGYPETKQKLENLGYKIIEIEMSEFQKHDGGLTCLSLRF